MKVMHVSMYFYEFVHIHTCDAHPAIKVVDNHICHLQKCSYILWAVYVCFYFWFIFCVKDITCDLAPLYIFKIHSTVLTTVISACA